MRICRHCGVKIQNDFARCPLCDMQTVKTDDEFSLDYPYVKSRFGRKLLVRLITFCTVVLIAASLLVDHLVPTDSKWAFITAAALVYGWISAINVLWRIPNPASIIFCQLISAGLFCFAVDFVTGFYRWSVNYVVPSLIIAASLALTIMITVRPQKYRVYVIYQLITAVLGVLSILLWVLGYSKVEWPTEAAAFISVLCFLAVTFFSARKTENELKKRFHV